MLRFSSSSSSDVFDGRACVSCVTDIKLPITCRVSHLMTIDAVFVTKGLSDEITTLKVASVLGAKGGPARENVAGGYAFNRSFYEFAIDSRGSNGWPSAENMLPSQ